MSLGFGTSGVRGLVTELTDRECALYTRAFLRHVRTRVPVTQVALAGDFRSSTPRILRAAAFGAALEGVAVDYCGCVPTPALASHAFRARQPSVMVTGSHIPDDRNGLKFNLPWGEVLKDDERPIQAAYAALQMAPGAEFAAAFQSDGMLKVERLPELGPPNPDAARAYLERYQRFFPAEALAGRRVVLYEHSTVGREPLRELLVGLGAEVIPVGRSDRFVPVDTEAVEHPQQLAAWVEQHGADALVSADGDSDRPLLVDEQGAVVRGDVLGILVAGYLGADAVATPVSCNTALEACGQFPRIRRTRIGSPYVVEAMQEAQRDGCRCVVGYEANGGFLLGSDVSPAGEGGRAPLWALPTRDAALPLLAGLHEASRRGLALSQLVATLPRRFTASGLLRRFPTEQGRALVASLEADGAAAVTRLFGGRFGAPQRLDFTDGARITFASGDIVHLRPSGNAPEFRCYTEAEAADRAARNNAEALECVRQNAAASLPR